MKLALSISVCLAAVASASTIASTTASMMSAMMDDFSELGQQFIKIASDVNAFPQTGMAGVQDIHDDAAAIHGFFLSINDNLDALPRPVSKENIVKIFSTYQSFTPNIFSYLNGITNKVADFKALGSASSTISFDLLGSVSPCVHFGGTVMSMLPPAINDTASVMFNDIDLAKQNAINALA